MEGSSEARSELIDIEVASLDGETLIELSNVRTVNQIADLGSVHCKERRRSELVSFT